MKCPHCKGTGQCEESVVDTYYRIKNDVQRRLKKEDREVEIYSDYGKGIQVSSYPWRVWFDGENLKFSVDHREVKEGPSDLAALARAAYASWRKTGTIR